MSAQDKVIHLMMVREDLEGVPRCQPPRPYHLREYRPGDEEAWFRIWLESDRYNVITPELFRRQFGDDAEELRRRQYYLCDGREAAIGTATAWHNEHFPGRPWGRVHWVAVVPGFQGLGLGNALMSAVLARMKELGCEGAYLTTESPRTAAINLYLKFGFRPHVRSEEEAEAWAEARGRVEGPARRRLMDAGLAAWARRGGAP